jgi:hypothetical protein
MGVCLQRAEEGNERKKKKKTRTVHDPLEGMERGKLQDKDGIARARAGIRIADGMSRRAVLSCV